MIKIVYIINSLRNNGPVNVLINMINGIDTSKFNVSVITLINEDDDKLVYNLEKKKINVIQLNLKKNFLTMFKIRKIKKVIKDNKFDIIHTHGYVPTIMCQKIKIEKVTTVHCRLKEDFCDTYGRYKGITINYFYIKALRRYNTVVSCSKSVDDIVSKKIKKSIYIKNGIDIKINKKKEHSREELGIPEDAIVYIYVGVLNNRKNVLNMLKFMEGNISNKEYLIIIGDGIYKDSVKKYESDNIKILGFKKNVYDYLFISDVYVSFSLSEGFPISVIEALGCNLLLLISDIPSHKEFLDIDNEIYIGEIFNSSNILNKLVKVRKNAKKKRNTSEFQKKYLSSRTMMENYENEYYNILEMKG